MSLYCPRCATTFDEIAQEALISGECTTCHGQLSAGNPSIVNPLVDGLVAMGFGDGSPVGTPLQVQLNNRELEAGADYQAVTAARTAVLAKAAAEHAARRAAEAAAAAAAQAAAAKAVAAANADRRRSTPESTSPPPWEVPKMPNAEQPSAPSPEPAAVFNPPAPDPATAAKPRSAAAVPGNVAMPSFDFSMPALPDFGSPGGAAPAPAGSGLDETPSYPESAAPAAQAAAASPSTAGLPAHLQLPSFPKFDVNFDQPAQPAAPPAGASAAMPQLPGMPPGMPPPGPMTPPGGMPAHLMPGALPAGLPPMPPPEPELPAEPQPEALPSLPNLGLPDLPLEERKREPTLLASEAASELAQELEKRRSAMPILIGAFAILAVLGGLAFWQRDKIVEIVTGEAPGPVVLTNEQKADAALAAGLLVAKEADNLKGPELKAKLADAIKEYNRALELNPKLPAAHLRLAVAYAKSDDKAKAVTHYEKFVELDPEAPQAKDVKKIIEDWYKAQKKDNGEAKDPKADDGDAKKKKKKKR